MDISEILESPAFWILTGIGELVFVIMLIAWNKMGHSDLMPWWAKLATFVLIPIIASLFSGYAEG